MHGGKHTAHTRCTHARTRSGTGFVTADMIARHLPAPADDVLVVRCGPPPMNDVRVRVVRVCACRSCVCVSCVCVVYIVCRVCVCAVCGCRVRVTCVSCVSCVSCVVCVCVCCVCVRVNVVCVCSCACAYVCARVHVACVDRPSPGERSIDQASRVARFKCACARPTRPHTPAAAAAHANAGDGAAPHGPGLRPRHAVYVLSDAITLLGCDARTPAHMTAPLPRAPEPALHCARSGGG